MVSITIDRMEWGQHRSGLQLAEILLRDWQYCTIIIILPELSITIPVTDIIIVVIVIAFIILSRSTIEPSSEFRDALPTEDAEYTPLKHCEFTRWLSTESGELGMIVKGVYAG